jgi:hypothetical protein
MADGDVFELLQVSLAFGHSVNAFASAASLVSPAETMIAQDAPP